MNNKEKTATDAVEQNESVRKPSEPLEGQKIKVRRGHVDSIIIYEISESELQILETGSPSSIYLNIFIFLFGLFLSYLSTLLAVDFTSKNIVQTVFIIITVVSGFLSGIMLVIWLKNKHDLSDVIKRIKSRVE